ncbi:MAG: sigma-70 family RNA polymerase sigma factor [Bryobacteraceae bacterium]|jgi:RNA polymerase sigma-70 factor (ECF subfamily)
MTEAAARETFLRLMEEFQGALARLASAYLSDSADRDDLVQEIATAIWQAIPRFRGESSERTWLYRIAHNTAITRAARVRRRARSEAALDHDHVAGAAGVDERLIRQQRRQILMALIRELPDADRQAMTLHLEGLSHGEIGEVTGATPGAIATRLSRIRERLTHELQR